MEKHQGPLARNPQPPSPRESNQDMPGETREDGHEKRTKRCCLGEKKKHHMGFRGRRLDFFEPEVIKILGILDKNSGRRQLLVFFFCDSLWLRDDRN